MTRLSPRQMQEDTLRRLEARSPVGHDTTALCLERADVLVQLGRNEEAKSAYFDILAVEPTHFGALNNLGALLYSTGYRTAARTAYTQAVALHPGNATGHVNLANALRENGEPVKARVHYEAALKLKPDHAEAHQGMAYLLMELGQEELAREHRQSGFRNHAVTTLPYRGIGAPVPLLLLISADGGNVPIRPMLDDRIFETTVLAAEFYDTDKPLPAHQLVFNAIGDADLCGLALECAERLLARTTAPIINPPASVRVTGRVENTQRLGTLPDVIAPKTALLPRSLFTSHDLQQRGFSFPLLIRRPGFHTGQFFARVENENELAAALAAIPGNELLAIDYLDAGRSDGKSRKYRVMMIAGQLYPLHVAISRDWKIHYFTADMKDNPEHRAEDAAFLHDMPTVLGQRAMEALRRIQATLALDYAGIDFGLGANGDLLLFEANATMTVNPPEPGERWDYRRAPVQRILDAVRSLLAWKATQENIPALLTSGGDSRIICDPKTGLNQYGCASTPDPGILSYSSSTATTISPHGLAAAEQLHKQILHSSASAPSIYVREMERIRTELIRLNQLSAQTDIVFAASGTDLHLLVPQLIDSPLLVIAAQPSETGSFVPTALSGRHFSHCTAFAPSVPKGEAIGSKHSEVAVVAIREQDGQHRPALDIDAEFKTLAAKAVVSGQHILMTLIDVSKTGLMAPSPACAIALQKRYPDHITILVDACQFRITPATLRAYLEQNFLVAVTGSKFVTGPAFSGALLIPETIAARLRGQPLPTAFNAYSTRADWPAHWAARITLADNPNMGLLLRWEAALAELRAFHTLSEDAITGFLGNFADAICKHLTNNPVFEPLPVRPLNRTAITTSQSWDRIQTIFPFLLRRPHGYLSCAEIEHVYKQLRENGCYLGQPVTCGMREGNPVTALRICADMRLVADALSPQGCGAEAVINRAIEVLDKTAALAIKA